MTSATTPDGGADDDRTLCGECGFSVVLADGRCPLCDHAAGN